MNIFDPILVVMVALLAVNLYMALAVHEIVRTLAASKKPDTVGTFSSDYDDEDDLFDDAEAAVLKAGKCSTSLLQRKFRIGYGRAAFLGYPRPSPIPKDGITRLGGPSGDTSGGRAGSGCPSGTLSNHS